MTVDLLTMTESDYTALTEAADEFLRAYFTYIELKHEGEAHRMPTLPRVSSFEAVREYQQALELAKADKAAIDARRRTAYTIAVEWRDKLAQKMPSGVTFEILPGSDTPDWVANDPIEVRTNGTNIYLKYVRLEGRYQVSDNI